MNSLRPTEYQTDAAMLPTLAAVVLLPNLITGLTLPLRLSFQSHGLRTNHSKLLSLL